MSEERKRFYYSLIFPSLFLLAMWMVMFYETTMEVSFMESGVYPRRVSGLKGILFSPLIHAGWKHLVDNSTPILFLGVALFYFYRDIAYRIWFLIYFISGLLLWGLGRQAYHIGASGLIYGMAAFLFTSGLIRKVRNLMAISLLVVFWYGGLVWGLLPYDYQVSFEGHITGAVSGVLLALIYRNEGPEPETTLLDEEEEEEEGPESDEKNQVGPSGPDRTRGV